MLTNAIELDIERELTAKKVLVVIGFQITSFL